ncbi:DUF6504 family protein [Pseudokineococcus basanitobsidens]|uniref:DUF6504 family protein n=1 Tax=Pseudokineococcus basanitobsidens TaxID=1926649 RepID=A0ABU8RHF6_9ACTN
MARTYDDEVAVRTAPAGAPEHAGEEQPDAFVWHGRLHVVRAVLGRWYERRAWWEQDPQRAPDPPPALAAAGGRGAATGDGSPTGAGRTASRSPSLDRVVWRVEAGAGRSAGSGVYELCREDPARPDGWSLRRVDD